MRVLNFLVTAKYNYLMNNIIDYITDRGHFVTVLDGNWLDEKNKLNVEIMPLNKLNLHKYDYVIDIDNIIAKNVAPKINFILEVKKDNLDLTIILDKKNKIYKLSEFTTGIDAIQVDNINNYYDEITEQFIDAIMLLLHNENNLISEQHYKNNNNLQYLLQLNYDYKTLNDYHHDCEILHESSYKLITGRVKSDDLYKEYEQHGVRVTVNELELLGLYLQMLFNARLGANYAYDILAGNKLLSKIIPIEKNDNYTKLKSKINHYLYDITKNQFYITYRGNNPGSQMLLSFGVNQGCCDLHNNYGVIVEYDDKTQILRLRYLSSLYFFNNSDKLINYFLHHIIKWQNANLDIQDLLYSEISLYSEQLIMCNQKANECANDKTIHQLFEEQVARIPDNIAVVYEDTQLTYRELNRQANQLAYYLREKYQMKGDDLILLCLDRNELLLIAILAILKAGGAYVPVDPRLPNERIDYVLQDTNAKVVLVNEIYIDKLRNIITNTASESVISVKTRLPKKQILNTLCPIDSIEFNHGLKDQPSNNLIQNTTNKNLAYVIYTSGTTGKPKGVMVEHHGVTSLVTAVNYISVTSDDTMIQLADIAFDAATFEIWGALLNGAKLIVPDDKYTMLTNVNNFKRNLKKHKISILWLTKTVFDSLYLEDEQLFQQLRYLLIGGEALNAQLVHKLANSEYRPEEIINGYGPTENTTFSCTFNIKKLSSAHELSVPIGKPLSNRFVCVLDTNLRPLPIGAIGELYVGGVGLARGYLNRPELDKERFIASPFQSQEVIKSHKLYKTGDLVRYLVDGNLEYLGRNDHQVKIRGFRIELGEIETILGQYEGIEQNVVLAREHLDKDARPNGKHYLVGYYVANVILDEELLLAYLAVHLPDYMIPSTLIQLTALPLTPNGKLDRVALPLPKLANGKNYVAPQGKIEIQMVDILADILSLPSDKVGRHDSFFRLGGDSISAIKLIGRINHMYRLSLTIAAIFNNSTIAKLSNHIEKYCHNHELSMSLSMVNRTQLIPLSLMQRHLWIVDKLEPNPSLYNIVSVCKCQGTLNLQAFEHALSFMVQRHENLRTTFQEVDGEPYQVILPFTDKINYSCKKFVENMLLDPEDLIKKQLLECQTINFSLANGPLYKFDLLSINHEIHVFVFIVHHIISDGWSLAVFYRELGQLYSSFANNEKVSLTPLEAQYADFAIYQHNFFSEKVLKQQLSYWQGKLTNLPDQISLPFDKPRLAYGKNHSGTIFFSIDQVLKRKLTDVCNQCDVTLYMFLITTYIVLLKRYSQQDSVIVGSPIINRKLQELESVFGFFINIVAIDARFDAKISFLELLKQLKVTILDAFQNQDVPFEQVVEALKIKRDLSRNPIFQAVFILNNMEQPKLNISGLRSSDIELSRTLIKFDLLLSTVEKNDTIEFVFEYATELFHKETIERLSANFVTLLESIVNNIHAKVNKLPLISKIEQDIMCNWMHNDKNYGKDNCLHHILENRIINFKDKPALYFADEVLSFEEFNFLANQLARLLQKEGVKPGDFIVVSMDKNIEFAIVLLAILKAGGIYLPLRKDNKQAQIKEICQQIESKLIICDEKSYVFFGENIRRLICNKELINTLQNYSNTNLETSITANDYLYVLFTSGSTGIPKGVLGKHLGILSRFYWMWEQYPYLEDEVCCLFTPINTIDIIFELFGPLLQGKPVVILPDDSILDMEKFIQTLMYHKVTRIDFVPSYLKALLDEHHDIATRLPRVKLWGVNGELLAATLIQQFAEQLPKATLVSRYGATEATTVFFHEYRNGKISRKGNASGATLQLLDKNRQLVPIGSIGEIYVAGPSVSDGYLNQKELTEERFVTLGADNKVFFSSGDLARLHVDGSIEFLGRKDFQVKIRGFTVNLKRIEELIQGQNYVKNVVVLAKNDETNQANLFAYVVLKHPVEAAPVVIKNSIKNYLPAYMMPHAIHIISGIPLTHNGKIDRTQLLQYVPETEKCVFVKDSEYTKVESELMKIWQELLLINHDVDKYANFFELGGHSLLATRMLSKIRQHFTVQITLQDIFLEPTIFALAKNISVLSDDAVEIDLMIDTNNDTIANAIVSPVSVHT